MTHRIYTTMRPDEQLEVDDTEYADLAAQGLILTEINPETGEVTGDAQNVPAPLDAAETVTDDQPPTAAEPSTRSGG